MRAVRDRLQLPSNRAWNARCLTSAILHSRAIRRGDTPYGIRTDTCKIKDEKTRSRASRNNREARARLLRSVARSKRVCEYEIRRS
eukprot:2350951-Rhodomonas_salina.1